MKQRTPRFMALLAISLVGMLRLADGQAQTEMPRVGVLTLTPTGQWLQPFRQTLRERGWVEGENVVFEYRVAGGDLADVSELAAELVRLNVDVLFPVGQPAVHAAFVATRKIPIVAHDLDTDPVEAGYAQSWNRPGGNITGVFLESPELAGKWVELLKAVVPNLSRVVAVWDPTSGPVRLDAVRNAASKLRVTVQVVEVRTPADINQVASAFGRRPQAMIILPSPMMWAQSARLAQFAKKHRLPGISMLAPFADAGGLLVYGPDMPATTEQCAALVAKILSGAKPGDLPAERAAKFEFVLNMKTARDLHLKIPDTVVLRADRVIK